MRGLRDGTVVEKRALPKKKKGKKRNESLPDAEPLDVAEAASSESASEMDAMAVAGFERVSEAEMRRLRVQRWLKEHRVRRNKVLLEMESLAREEALR